MSNKHRKKELYKRRNYLFISEKIELNTSINFFNYVRTDKSFLVSKAEEAEFYYKNSFCCKFPKGAGFYHWSHAKNIIKDLNTIKNLNITNYIPLFNIFNDKLPTTVKYISVTNNITILDYSGFFTYHNDTLHYCGVKWYNSDTYSVKLIHKNHINEFLKRVRTSGDLEFLINLYTKEYYSTTNSLSVFNKVYYSEKLFQHPPLFKFNNFDAQDEFLENNVYQYLNYDIKETENSI